MNFDREQYVGTWTDEQGIVHRDGGLDAKLAIQHEVDTMVSLLNDARVIYQRNVDTFVIVREVPDNWEGIHRHRYTVVYPVSISNLYTNVGDAITCWVAENSIAIEESNVGTFVDMSSDYHTIYDSAWMFCNALDTKFDAYESTVTRFRGQ